MGPARGARIGRPALEGRGILVIWRSRPSLPARTGIMPQADASLQPAGNCRIQKKYRKRLRAPFRRRTSVAAHGVMAVHHGIDTKILRHADLHDGR
ncbi:hypothetical protein C4900_03595 [Acidiferrobacter thiooxydans]|uniref:Uncharacterized protein n=1 Tax=Acidiferrobacter thiooxydans TaxID=163359 RepID=A0A1C2FZP3_9GAMM|nr:hypothetical protein C4900_03595 [Acidiferrobacter thiooxydans]